MMMNPSEFDAWLRKLRANERASQVELLLALVEFDRHEVYLALGYDKLWTYCMKVLHLCEGATYRRTHAVKLLQRFPQLVEHLRDGRLNLSTLVELKSVLTDDNVEAITAQAAYMSKSEVERLVATLKPSEEPPQELAFRRAPTSHTALAPIAPEPTPTVAPAPPPARPPARPTVEVAPVSEDQWLLKGRFSDRLKRKMERARELASHAIPSGQWEAVLEAALDCYIEKLEKRREARTENPRQTSKPPKSRRTISAEVRRAVSERDEGCCAWRGPDGHRCGSKWQLEYDHIDPEGPSTVENVRMLCRPHNRLHAEEIYGKEHMDRFRRDPTSAGESPRDLSHEARSSHRRQDASPQPSATGDLQSQLELNSMQ
jgi:hypothetical protein